MQNIYSMLSKLIIWNPYIISHEFSISALQVKYIYIYKTLKISTPTSMIYINSSSLSLSLSSHHRHQKWASIHDMLSNATHAGFKVLKWRERAINSGSLCQSLELELLLYSLHSWKKEKKRYELRATREAVYLH